MKCVCWKKFNDRNPCIIGINDTYRIRNKSVPAKVVRKPHLLVYLVLCLTLMIARGGAQSRPVISYLPNNLNTLCSFDGANGASPSGELVKGSDGNFYGTTEGGGSSGDGVIFRVSTSGSLTTLCSFSGTNGANPYGALVQGTDGNFYGTTSKGGSSSIGTVFRVTTSGSFTMLCSFSTTTGYDPLGGLVQGSDGNLYGTSCFGGTLYAGTVIQVTTSGSLRALYSFTGVSGEFPRDGLVQGNDGNLYGTTFGGGYNGVGAVFRITTSGSFTTLYSFTSTTGNNPYGGLVQGSDGNFYGTTYGGGSNREGTVFRVTPGGSLTTLFSFDGETGANPYAGLVEGADGNFYGTTSQGGSGGGGTAFQITPNGILTTLCSFGGNPYAGVTQGSDGNIYGTTQTGGSSDDGMVFRLSPSVITAQMTSGFNFQIVASNSPTSYGASGLPAGLSVNPSTGLISGTPTMTGTFPISISATNAVGASSAPMTLVVPLPPVITSATTAAGEIGERFAYQIAGINNPTSYSASGLPVGLGVSATTGLISGIPTVSGTFDATINASNGDGTGSTTLTIAVMPLPPVIANLPTNLVSLCSFTGTNGELPEGGLALGSDGNLYGVTENGGSSGDGTVFQLTPMGTLALLYSFNGANSGNPYGGLTSGSDGNLYGTSENGGNSGGGTVFQVTTSGLVTMVCSFSYWNGANPYGGILQGIDGNFYGTTESGGSNGDGTVFQVNSSGSLTTLCSFSGTNGANPYGGVVQGTDGNFYGTTESGGSNGAGTVFEATSSGSLTTLYSFSGNDGANPYGGLVQGNDGNFYGTTESGGSNGDGTVFKITSGGTLTTLCLFTGTNGANPYAGLLRGSDGNFYGTTENGGSSNDGTAFQITPGGILTTLCSFTGTNGANPYGGLMQGTDGSLYGTTGNGGSSGDGTAFRLSTSAITAVTGTGFNYQIVATNNPINYVASGLPAGLNVNSTGLISGTAGATGTFAVTISAINMEGTDSETFTLNILPPVPQITSSVAVSSATDSAFNYQITATNNPVSFNAAGLPPGLSVDASTGLISGTPTEAGIFTTTISATNAGGSGFSILSLAVRVNFKEAKGSYDGLAAVGGTNAGLFTMSLTSKGTFTGKLKLAGTQYPLKGSFSSYGTFSNIWSEGEETLEVSLTVDPSVPQISGTITITTASGSSSYIVEGDLVGNFNASTFPPGLAGSYTATIPPVSVNNPAVPGADGYGTVTVIPTGAVHIAGKLGDGTAFSAGGHLHADGKTWTFFKPLYAGRRPGGIAGTMTFEALGESDCDGAVDWIKPQQASGTYYASGFSISTELLAAKYTPPPLTSGTANIITIGGGDLPDTAVMDSLKISSQNKVTVTGQNEGNVSLFLNRSTGYFSGTFLYPGTNEMTSFGGVIFQKPAPAGFGLFLGIDKSGAVTITQ